METGITVTPQGKENIESVKINISDRTQERCILNLLPLETGNKIEKIINENPGLFMNSEAELHSSLRKSGATPTLMDNRIRLNFWYEYGIVQAQRLDVLNMINVAGGLTDYNYFMNVYLAEPKKIAWMLCPPAGYRSKVSEALAFGVDKMREILDLEHMDPLTGKLNTSVLNMKLKITQMLHDWDHGSVVQRSVAVNINKEDIPKMARMSEALGHKELDRQIKNMKRRNRQLLHLPDIEVPGEEEKEVVVDGPKPV